MTNTCGPEQPIVSVLVTGADGFIGRRLVRRLVMSDRFRVRALVRRPPDAADPAVDWIVGDLLKSETYRAHLADIDLVIHLGAAVGRCPVPYYFRVNRDATQELLNRCRQANVKRFIFISTIAVKFDRLDEYPYAKSKRQAETAVRNCGIAYQIVRPTIVVGPSSPNWASLVQLATLPVTPLFGGGSRAVQPIDVEDVAEFLSNMAVGPIDEREIELGGPDVILMSDFLKRIHDTNSERPFRGMPIPLGPIRTVLAALERIAGHRLPLTRGQLAVFGNDSTIEPSDAWRHWRPKMHGVDAMIARANATVPTRVPADLIQEAQVFSQSLLGRVPSDRVTNGYLAAHDKRVIDVAAYGGWDRRLVGLAKRHVWICRALDNYCRFIRPQALLRRKLVLLLAHWECEPTSESDFELPQSVSPLTIGIRIAFRLACCALITLTTACLLLPIRLVTPNRVAAPGAKDLSP